MSTEALKAQRLTAAQTLDESDVQHAFTAREKVASYLRAEN